MSVHEPRQHTFISVHTCLYVFVIYAYIKILVHSNTTNSKPTSAFILAFCSHAVSFSDNEKFSAHCSQQIYSFIQP
jgi:hypothetical protein